MRTATLNQLSLACMDWLNAHTVQQRHLFIIFYRTKQYEMIFFSKPGKSQYLSMYISIMFPSIFPLLCVLFIAPNPPSLPPVCLSSLMARYQARNSADGVSLFLIGWLQASGRGLTTRYINIVAGQTAELGSWCEGEQMQKCPDSCCCKQ